MPTDAPWLYDNANECFAAIRKQMAWTKRVYKFAQPICYFLADEHLSPYRAEDLQKLASEVEQEQFGFEQYIGKSVVHWMLSNKLAISLIQKYLAEEQFAPALEVLETRTELRRAVHRKFQRPNTRFNVSTGGLDDRYWIMLEFFDWSRLRPWP